MDPDCLTVLDDLIMGIRENPIMCLFFKASLPNVHCPFWIISMLIKKQFTCPLHRIVQIYRVQVIKKKKKKRKKRLVR